MFINHEKLEQLLLANWTFLLDRNLLIRNILENVRDAKLPVVQQKDVPPAIVKVIVTKFAVKDKTQFELWIEFSIPKDEGLAIGSQVYTLGLDGELNLQESYGTVFLPEITQ